MKKFNGILIGVVCFYLVIAVAAGLLLQRQSEERSREYLVEVNVIMRGMEEQGSFSMPALHEFRQIQHVSFLDAESMEDSTKLDGFFQHRNGMETHIEPFNIQGKNLGMVRFDYISLVDLKKEFWLVEGVIVLSGICMLLILFYVKTRLLKPFMVLSNMPYELSKGRLGTEIQENKNKFFGKFVWGIAVLRDNLKSTQLKTLKLEKEKKMLLLLISHDIKTPLNTIKLYAKAMEEGLYDTDEKQKQAAGQIEKLAIEIEDFVKEIVRTSSEEVVNIEVENAEFYLADLASMIREYYGPKCKLVMTEFVIGKYDNKLLKGNKDSAFEVVENIMENAFKYGDGRLIEITFYEEEYCQLIKIKNTGTPVKTEEMPHLFDSFFRGSNIGNREGNGLGLYICREIMRKMEGNIFARQEADGMSFQLVFHI